LCVGFDWLVLLLTQIAAEFTQIDADYFLTLSA
jgi:hypothetical protein